MSVQCFTTVEKNAISTSSLTRTFSVDGGSGAMDNLSGTNAFGASGPLVMTGRPLKKIGNFFYSSIRTSHKLIQERQTFDSPTSKGKSNSRLGLSSMTVNNNGVPAQSLAGATVQQTGLPLSTSNNDLEGNTAATTYQLIQSRVHEIDTDSEAGTESIHHCSISRRSPSENCLRSLNQQKANNSLSITERCSGPTLATNTETRVIRRQNALPLVLHATRLKTMKTTSARSPLRVCHMPFPPISDFLIDDEDAWTDEGSWCGESDESDYSDCSDSDEDFGCIGLLVEEYEEMLVMGKGYRKEIVEGVDEWPEDMKIYGYRRTWDLSRDPENWDI
ncbi:hypothetical protein ABW20_dc0100782 [Dactylellina cionopaga]|nr:hypothetical protein ABW20_dc0100782 [Dactylellina cionopaga]